MLDTVPDKESTLYFAAVIMKTLAAALSTVHDFMQWCLSVSEAARFSIITEVLGAHGSAKMFGSARKLERNLTIGKSLKIRGNFQKYTRNLIGI